MVHAARCHGEPKGEGLENARIVRVGLEQALDRHAVIERAGRVFAALHRAGRVRDRVAKALAFGGHEQQLLDDRVVAPCQVEPAGLLGRDDAALVELHGPGNGASGGGRVQPQVVENIVQAQHLLGLLDADHGTELAQRDVLGAIALVVAVVLAVAVDTVVGALLAVFDQSLVLVVAGIAAQSLEGRGTPAGLGVRRHVILVAAMHRAQVAAVHTGAIGIKIVGVELRRPTRLLVVLGTQRAQDAAGLVQEGRADHLQGVLDHAGRYDLLADDLVVFGHGLHRLQVFWRTVDHDSLDLERAHLGATTTARPDGLDATHDAAAQHLVFTGCGNARQRHVLTLDAFEVPRNCGRHVEVVQTEVGRGVDEFDGVIGNPEHGPGRSAAEQDHMVVAVATQKGGKVVARIGVQNRITIGRLAGDIAAGGRGHAAGQHAGAEDQRNLRVQRIALFFHQVVEQPHVGTAPTQKITQNFQRQVLLEQRALLQIDEEYRALRVVLRRVVHAGDESLQFVSDGHVLVSLCGGVSGGLAGPQLLVLRLQLVLALAVIGVWDDGAHRADLDALGDGVVPDTFGAQRRVDVENVFTDRDCLIRAGCQTHIAGDAQVIDE